VGTSRPHGNGDNGQSARTSARPVRRPPLPHAALVPKQGGDIDEMLCADCASAREADDCLSTATHPRLVLNRTCDDVPESLREGTPQNRSD
jgi:hypothetical protein